MSGPRPQPDHSSARYHDLIYDKTKALTDFFTFVGKAPAAATPADVQAWQHGLEERGLAEATVYALVTLRAPYRGSGVSHE